MVIEVEISSPNRAASKLTADEIVLPSLTGQIGVLENHAPLVAGLAVGLLRIKLINKWNPMIVCGGIVAITQNRVVILANEIQEIDSQLDVNKATVEVEKAVEVLNSIETSKESLEAIKNLKIAMARLEGLDYLS